VRVRDGGREGGGGVAWGEWGGVGSGKKKGGEEWGKGRYQGARLGEGSKRGMGIGGEEGVGGRGSRGRGYCALGGCGGYAKPELGGGRKMRGGREVEEDSKAGGGR